MAFEEYWNESHKKYGGAQPKFDNWLDKYLNRIEATTLPILDLGCGTGNDSLYLTLHNKKVIACDYSSVALDDVKKFVPNSVTLQIDFSKGLPFNDNSFDIIVADLSLHYFDSNTTINIMKEVKRVLTAHGILLARVNSLNDINYGAGLGEKIEDNYYYVDGYNKRFFTLEDAQKFFSIVGEVTVTSAQMLRYSKPKELLEISVIVNK